MTWDRSAHGEVSPFRTLAAFGVNVPQRREAFELPHVKAAEKADFGALYISGMERSAKM